MDPWGFISSGRLNNDCPASLNYQYNLGLKGPSNIYQIFGDVGEAGVEAILRNKSREFDDPHIIESECRLKLEERLNQTGVDAPTEQDLWRVISAVLKFRPSPNYELLATQEEIWLEMPRLPIPVKGFLDFRGLEEGEMVIDDTKVTSQNITKPKFEWIIQLGIYALAIKHRFRLDYLPRTRIILLIRSKKPEVRILEVNIDSEVMSNIFIRAEMISHFLKNDYWPPNRQAQYCNERNCAHWYRCHADHLVPWRELMELPNNEELS